MYKQPTQPTFGQNTKFQIKIKNISKKFAVSFQNSLFGIIPVLPMFTYWKIVKILKAYMKRYKLANTVSTLQQKAWGVL